MIKKKYLQLGDLLIRTYKTYKYDNGKTNKDCYIYVMKVDKALQKFKVLKIIKYKNCIIYNITLIA